MAKEGGSIRNFWEGIASALLWLLKAILVALALYILFPPFWDALFAANLQALHDAPYRAADRAARLWSLIARPADRQADQHRGGAARSPESPSPASSAHWKL